MHHKMTIRRDEAMPARPFFASCSCGPQGNFAKKEEAKGYLDFHRGNVLGGINTAEFVDETLLKEELVQEQVPKSKKAKKLKNGKEKTESAQTLGDA